MKSLKVRFLAMGSILSALGVILYEVRGHNTADLALLAVGIIFLVLGLVWP